MDSEYVIFIIDTSGSMHNYAWSMVRKKMEKILDRIGAGGWATKHIC